MKTATATDRTRAPARARLTSSFATACVTLLVTTGLATAPAAEPYAPALSDVATLEGVRDNALYGYGLVIGLQGTGDGRQTGFTNQTLRNFLERQGITLAAGRMRVDNVAGVVVTATLSPFARPGTPIDVNVASIGDATSLRGGVLLLTPLAGADGQIYATSQGPLTVGGAFAADGGGGSTQLNHATVATIPSGGIVERPSPTTLIPGQALTYVLKRADFRTAQTLAKTIDEALGPGSARAIDARRVVVDAATRANADPVAIAATIERLRIPTDGRPRVVVNERTGSIVAGAEIRLRPVSIVHGGLTIEVHTEYEIAQPAPLSDGVTTIVPRSEVLLTEAPAQGLVLEEGSTVGELVHGLTMLGAGASDIITVLQLMQRAGALDVDVEVM